MTIALVGPRNCGKSTLFNRLTGGSARVGNFPGVTVERKSGLVLGHEDWEIVDLPGVCSLHPRSPDEAITRRFLLDDRPDVIINAADATALERGLYLTLQLTQLDIPTVLALNMTDELSAGGGSVDERVLSGELGLPVVNISARRGLGLDELLRQCAAVRGRPPRHVRQAFSETERCLRALESVVGEGPERAGIPARFAASCLLAGDEEIIPRLALTSAEAGRAERIIARTERVLGLDRAGALVTSRWAAVDRLCGQCVKKPAPRRSDRFTLCADRLLAGSPAAIPVFICVMLTVFFCSFHLAGGFADNVLAPALDALFRAADGAMLRFGVHPLVRSLVSEGVFAGAGTVVRFMPVIFILLLLLSLLEDCGYLARIAFITDRPLARLGLSGASAAPLLMGFGCTVPAVTAARTLPDARERLAAAMLTPFMSCSAKLPVYALFTAALFPKARVLVMLGLYLLGIICFVPAALLMRHLSPRGDSSGFVMELPRYRLPSLRGTVRLAWDRALDFLRRTFSIILLASVAVWFLRSFDARFQPVSNPAHSLLAGIGGLLTPLFAPLGFGDWRACTALMAGLLAKEAVVGTLGVLLGSAPLASVFTPRSALSFLVFVLLYTPCAAALACLHRETGSAARTAAVALFQCAAAWLCSALVYALTGLFV